MKVKIENRKVKSILGIILGAFFLLSNRSGVPQAVTLAPGEPAGKNCSACHSPSTNYQTKVDLKVMNLDSTSSSIYIPGQKYIINVKVSGINNPKSYGFQLVSLIGNANKDAGLWSALGQKVKTQTLINRKYLVQSADKADGSFFATWTAPVSNDGDVKFYFSGLAINGNGNTDGDMSASSSLTLPGSGISNAQDSQNIPISIYPNPATNIIFVSHPSAVTYVISDVNGKRIQRGTSTNSIDVSSLPNGAYSISINDELLKMSVSKIFIKQ